MKLKLLAFTLLIGIISFAGFSLTTTDPCQDSNLEMLVSTDVDATAQGVVDSAELGFNLVEDSLSVKSYGTDPLTGTFDKALTPVSSEEVSRNHAANGVAKEQRLQKRHLFNNMFTNYPFCRGISKRTA